jgi:hypothetical protein
MICPKGANPRIGVITPQVAGARKVRTGVLKFASFKKS